MKIYDELKAEGILKNYREVRFAVTISEETALAMALYDRIKKLDDLIQHETSARIQNALLEDRAFLASMLHDFNLK